MFGSGQFIRRLPVQIKGDHHVVDYYHYFVRSLATWFFWWKGEFELSTHRQLDSHSDCDSSHTRYFAPLGNCIASPQFDEPEYQK
jgi:hypothetical protein